MTPVSTATHQQESPRPHLPPLLHQARRLALRRNRVGDCVTAQITDAKGNIIFEQKDVEVPKDWSMTATNIVASKYLHGTLGTPERETGVRALVTRVAETIRDWGMAQATSARRKTAPPSTTSSRTFWCASRRPSIRRSGSTSAAIASSPTPTRRTGTGTRQRSASSSASPDTSTPQCSACFINSVNDSLDSILTLAKTEGMLFKWGSGTGTNLSPLRSSTEGLSGGGTASGPLSFMKGFDAFAGVIKSGGKTRRAAKMVILNVDHPDIVDFIECKQKEEAKAHALVAAGYDGSRPDSDAYSSIFFQNANNSVRVTDDFMYAVLRDTDFSTRAVKDGRPMQTFKAKDLLLQDLRRHLALRRSRHAVRHHRQPLAHLEEHGAHQRQQSRAASTCSSTTRPATWPA